MSQKDRLKAAVAVVVLLIGVGLIMSRGRSPSRRGNAAPNSFYFYDLQTGKLFADDSTKLPPFTGPSGGEAVRAFVYTCGECTESQLVISHLQKLNEKAIETNARLANASAAERMPLYAQIQAGTFVASKPDAGQSPQWFSLTTSEGQEVTQTYQHLCSGKMALICTPDKTR